MLHPCFMTIILCYFFRVRYVISILCHQTCQITSFIYFFEYYFWNCIVRILVMIKNLVYKLNWDKNWYKLILTYDCIKWLNVDFSSHQPWVTPNGCLRMISSVIMNLIPSWSIWTMLWYQLVSFWLLFRDAIFRIRCIRFISFVSSNRIINLRKIVDDICVSIIARNIWIQGKQHK